MSGQIRMAALAILFLISGCGGFNQPAPEIDHYLMEYDPPLPDSRSPLPVILRIDPFKSAPFYAGRHMIYRERAYRRSQDAYHKWMVAPADMVSSLLSRDIAASGIVQGVVPHSAVVRATHSLTGIVEEFYAEDTSKPQLAVMSLHVTLLKENEAGIHDRIVFQRRYRETEPLDRRHPEAFVEAMSRAMARISSKMIVDLRKSLAPE